MAVCRLSFLLPGIVLTLLWGASVTFGVELKHSEFLNCVPELRVITEGTAKIQPFSEPNTAFLGAIKGTSCAALELASNAPQTADTPFTQFGDHYPTTVLITDQTNRAFPPIGTGKNMAIMHFGSIISDERNYLYKYRHDPSIGKVMREFIFSGNGEGVCWPINDKIFDADVPDTNAKNLEQTPLALMLRFGKDENSNFGCFLVDCHVTKDKVETHHVICAIETDSELVDQNTPNSAEYQKEFGDFVGMGNVAFRKELLGSIVSRMQEYSDKVKQSVVTYQAEVQKVDEAHKELSHKVSTLLDNVDKLLQEYKTTVADSKAVGSAKTERETKIKDLQTQVNASTGNLRKVRSQLSEKDTQLQSLRNEIEALKKGENGGGPNGSKGPSGNSGANNSGANGGNNGSGVSGTGNSSVCNWVSAPLIFVIVSMQVCASVFT